MLRIIRVLLNDIEKALKLVNNQFQGFFVGVH